ncbi:hypothetical protein F0U44_16675 [Nocardioides humilatus]|uniref:Uncharacterized protein n=1 Tax=Nocardioides humilatus TaxID=2607660 RepID=A0A5B1L873_9ACTN|nr:hypothetical protein [Nocardioides humilatus]KAA1416822.1 hypothetical protein F0U44_16675 [Nocardioides humilatus]
MSGEIEQELDRLRQLVGRLERANTALTHRMKELELRQPATAPNVEPGSTREAAPSRRGLVWLAGAGMAGAAAAVVARPTAAHADGTPVVLGAVNSADLPTEIKLNSGPYGNHPALVLRGEDNEGYASLGSGSIAVYGVSAVSYGRGVYGETAHAGGIGVVGRSSGGRYGVQGTWLKNPDELPGTAGVCGENLNTSSNGIGVIGSHAGSGWGVWATSVSGVGLYADGGTGSGAECVTTGGRADQFGVIGRVTSETPQYGSAGVRGINNARTDAGYGVHGSHDGTGAGVYGTSGGGIGVSGRGKNCGVAGLSLNDATHSAGVVGDMPLPHVTKGAGVRGYHGGSGRGVWAKSSGGPGLLAESTYATGAECVATGNADKTAGVLGRLTSTTPGASSAAVRAITNSTTNASYGVLASHAGTGTAVYGQSVGGVGVRGFGGTGRGGVFTGAAAQVNLTPGTVDTHPTSGTRGDLYVDSTGRLWFCKTGGTTATWAEVA